MPDKDEISGSIKSIIWLENLVNNSWVLWRDKCFDIDLLDVFIELLGQLNLWFSFDKSWSFLPHKVSCNYNTFIAHLTHIQDITYEKDPSSSWFISSTPPSPPLCREIHPAIQRHHLKWANRHMFYLYQVCFISSFIHKLLFHFIIYFSPYHLLITSIPFFL